MPLEIQEGALPALLHVGLPRARPELRQPGRAAGRLRAWLGLQGDCRIVGLGVYRSGALPSLQGYYLYGDSCSGRNTPRSASAASRARNNSLQLPGLSSISVVESGRLFATSGDSVFEIVANEPPTPTSTPTPDVFATLTPTPPAGATATPTQSSATPTETPLPGGPDIVGDVVEKDTEVEFTGASFGSLGVQIRDLTSGQTLGTGSVNGVGQGRVTLSSPAARAHRLATFDLSTQRQGPEWWSIPSSSGGRPWPRWPWPA